MSRTTLFLVLAAATSAEGNVKPWQKIPDLASAVKQIADTKGRRLQAKWMSSECTEACPKTMDFLTVMASVDQSDEAKMIEAMCPHTDAINCLSTTEACKSEGEEELMNGLLAIECACACPTLMSAMAEENDSDTPSPAQCEAMTCVMGASACEPLMATLSAEDKAEVDKCGAPADATSDDAPSQNTAFVIVALSVTAFFM